VTRLSIVGLALLLLPLQDRPRFQSAARTVFIYATVQGPAGRLVSDLTAADFTIRDEGIVQPITVFDNSPQKITLVAMFDMSRSMTSRYAALRDAAHALIEALWPDDRARLGTFGIEVALSPVLTSDKQVLRRVLDEELWPGGPTPLWSGAEQAMASLEKEDGRRVILLFTDGDDSGLGVSLIGIPAASLRGVRDRAERDNFMFYAVGMPGRGLSGAVTGLATDTGGGFTFVKDNEALGPAFAALVEQLHHQYVLGFQSDARDGRSHKLTIEARSGMKVRARKSYRAD
jgi:VWFA-related protein